VVCITWKHLIHAWVPITCKACELHIHTPTEQQRALYMFMAVALLCGLVILPATLCSRLLSDDGIAISSSIHLRAESSRMQCPGGYSCCGHCNCHDSCIPIPGHSDFIRDGERNCNVVRSSLHAKLARASNFPGLGQLHRWHYDWCEPHATPSTNNSYPTKRKARCCNVV
jgi:hypothetical protein